MPARTDLQMAYERLQFDSASVEPQELVLWSHWARIDPRLAEIAVQFMARNFETLNPLTLWKLNRESPSPQALAVLAEFAQIEIKTAQAPGSAAKRNLFLRWKKTVLSDLEMASPQMFFVPEGWPNPQRLQNEMNQNLKPYAKWGFFCRTWIAAPKSLGISRTATLLGPGERQRILDEMIETRDDFTVEDYISACQGRVHRRMAERDLRQRRDVAPYGQTRARRYRPRPKARRTRGL